MDDYFRRRGDEAYLFVRPAPRIHLGVSFRSDRHQSLRDLSGMATQIMAAALARAGAGPEVDERPPAVSLR